MNLRPDRSDERVDVNLTPLIDVVFLLLIFFMVSTTFDRHAKLKVELPEASAKTEQQLEDPLFYLSMQKEITSLMIARSSIHNWKR